MQKDSSIYKKEPRLYVASDGKRIIAYDPKEWYVVPLNIVDDAINILLSGKKVAYDDTLQQLITEE